MSRLKGDGVSRPIDGSGFVEDLRHGFSIGLVQNQLLLGLFEPYDVLLSLGPISHLDLVTDDFGDGEGHGLSLEVRCLEVLRREHQVDVETRVILLSGHLPPP